MEERFLLCGWFPAPAAGGGSVDVFWRERGEPAAVWALGGVLGVESWQFLPGLWKLCGLEQKAGCKVKNPGAGELAKSCLWVIVSESV